MAASNYKKSLPVIVAWGLYTLASSAQAVVCESALSDPDGDGYGFENNQSCLVVPTCEKASSDPDGDGWGWEKNQSCLVDTAVPPPCIDTDGDGWGWDGTSTCIIPDETIGTHLCMC